MTPEQVPGLIAQLWWLWLAITIFQGWRGYKKGKWGDNKRLPEGASYIETHEFRTINLGWIGRIALALFLLSLGLLIVGLD